MNYLSGSVSDPAPTLFPENKKVADALCKFSIIADDFSESVLAGGGMSTLWRLRGKMPEFFVFNNGVEVSVPFIHVLSQTYHGHLCFREVPLVDLVSPSRYFLSLEFAEEMVSFQHAKMNTAESAFSHMDVGPKDVLVEGVSKQDNVVTGEKAGESKLVVDSKEGIPKLPLKGGRKRRVLWDKSESGTVDLGLGCVSQRLRRKRWNTGTGQTVTGVINLLDSDEAVTENAVDAIVEGKVDLVANEKENAKSTAEDNSSKLALDVYAGKVWVDVPPLNQSLKQDVVLKEGKIEVEVPDVSAGTTGRTAGQETSQRSAELWEQFDEVVFRPDWNLTNSSNLLTLASAVEFVNHAIPSTTEAEMSKYSHKDLINFMRLFAAQNLCVISEGAARLGQLIGLNVDFSRLENEVKTLSLEVERLRKVEGEKASECQSLVVKLAYSEQNVSSLAAEKVKLSQELNLAQKEDLTLNGNIAALKDAKAKLQGEVGVWERQFAEMKSRCERITLERDWVVNSRVSGIINKIFDSSEFGLNVKHFCRACLMSGEKFGCDESLKLVCAAGEPSMEVDPIIDGMEQVLNELMLADYVSLFGFDRMDVQALKKLLTEESPEGDAGCAGAGSSKVGPVE